MTDNETFGGLPNEPQAPPLPMVEHEPLPPEPELPPEAELPPPAYRAPAHGQPLGAPYVPPVPPPEKKGRRVGALTMAICLIAVGGLMILRIFVPGLDYLTIARFSPLVLVMLGVELLVANARHKDEKLRFSGMSVFVSMLLICTSLAAAVVPEIIHYAVDGERVSRRLEAELEQETVTALKQSKLPVYNMEWYVDVGNAYFENDMSAGQLRPEHYVQVRVFLPGGYTEPASFAKDCHEVVAMLQAFVPHIDYASFYSTKNDYDSEYAGDTTFSLWLDNRYVFDESAAKMADMVQTNRWYGDGGYYVPEWEYQQMEESGIIDGSAYEAAIGEAPIDEATDEPADEDLAEGPGQEADALGLAA